MAPRQKALTSALARMDVATQTELPQQHAAPPTLRMQGVPEPVAGSGRQQ